MALPNVFLLVFFQYIFFHPFTFNLSMPFVNRDSHSNNPYLLVGLFSPLTLSVTNDTFGILHFLFVTLFHVSFFFFPVFFF